MSSPTPILPISTYPTHPPPAYSVSDTTRRTSHSTTNASTQSSRSSTVNPLRRISTYLKSSVTLEDTTQARCISHYGVFEGEGQEMGLLAKEESRRKRGSGFWGRERGSVGYMYGEGRRDSVYYEGWDGRGEGEEGIEYGGGDDVMDEVRGMQRERQRGGRIRRWLRKIG
jgi:hypothetical protein